MVKITNFDREVRLPIKTVLGEQNNIIVPILDSLGVSIYQHGNDNEFLQDHELGKLFMEIINGKPQYSIVVRIERPRIERVKTVLHEMGHIMLGHLLLQTPISQREREADAFAAFMMPYLYEPKIYEV
jgi:hypothetical protein